MRYVNVTLERSVQTFKEEEEKKQSEDRKHAIEADSDVEILPAKKATRKRTVKNRCK